MSLNKIQAQHIAARMADIEPFHVMDLLAQELFVYCSNTDLDIFAALLGQQAIQLILMKL